MLNFPLIATVVTSLKSEAEIGANPTLDHRRADPRQLPRTSATSPTASTSCITSPTASSRRGSAPLLAMLLAFPAAYAIARSGVGARWLLPIVTNLRAIPLIIFSIPIYLVYQQVAPARHADRPRADPVPRQPAAGARAAGQQLARPADRDRGGGADGRRRHARPAAAGSSCPWRRPVVASALILSFIYAWNEFLFGLMLTTERAVPITVGASFFFSASGGGIRWGDRLRRDDRQRAAAAADQPARLPLHRPGLDGGRRQGLSHLALRRPLLQTSLRVQHWGEAVGHPPTGPPAALRTTFISWADSRSMWAASLARTT